MFWLLKVLIGRNVSQLNRPFSYAYKTIEKPPALARVLVDFGHSKNIVGFIAEEPEWHPESVEDYKGQTGIRLAYIKEILDPEPIITPALNELAMRMVSHYYCPLISVYQAMLPPSLKPKNSSLNKPRAKLVLMVKRIGEGNDSLSLRANKLLITIGAQENGVPALAKLRQQKAYQDLLEAHLIAEYTVRQDRIKETPATVFETALTPEQKTAWQEISDSSKSTILLEGVTGSGKTLIYLELAKKWLAQGQGAIILVPEIILTGRMAALFKGTFGPRCSILHSNLTAATKYDEYRRIKEGVSQIVIGTRSAIFAPVKNLGLIILDEEQSRAYKQDIAPYYDARTVALMRSEIENIKVVLASATPLVEDKVKAEKGLYEWVYLGHKYAATPPVVATFIDMSDLTNISTQSTMLSKPLIAALDQTFKAHKQAMLFLNRRGFAPLMQCKNCHRFLKCPHCDIPLAVHQREQALLCHRCEFRQSLNNLTCFYCQKNEFYQLGHGTQRIETELKALFPQITIGRLDRDSTLKEKERDALLSRFAQGEISCLIGTEMIAKGHDFPQVTLAAALAADQSLALPTYMAGENTFDLIAQLVGRSGRADSQGQAFIQTYNPLNKELIYAARQDYAGFYAYEMKNRQKYLYPPYCYLCYLAVSSPDKKQVLDTVYALKTYLAGRFKDKPVNIYGPIEPWVSLNNDTHFRRIMLKYKNPADLTEAFNDIPTIFLPNHPGLNITIDIEPRDN